MDIDNENILYVGNFADEGIFIMDFTDLDNPLTLSTITFTESFIYSLEVFRNTSSYIISIMRALIYIIDVSDKTNPFIVGKNTTGGGYTYFTLRKG